MPPAITIGLPCYGRPAYLRAALEHFALQSEQGFRIILSENPSEANAIAPLAAEFAARGLNIHYRRHTEDIGMVANFMSVLRDADTEFFMWAADDDLRHPEALKTLLGRLVQYPEAGLAACSVEVINAAGTTIDFHGGFSRFTELENPADGVLRFMAEPELGGKANLIYGLFRTGPLRIAMEAIGGGFPECWGPDLVVLASFLSRFRVVAVDRALLRKRTRNDRVTPLGKRYPQDFGWPAAEFPAFRAAMLAALPDDTVRTEAARILDARQRHLAGIGLVRRTVLKATGFSTAPARALKPEDMWT